MFAVSDKFLKIKEYGVSVDVLDESEKYESQRFIEIIFSRPNESVKWYWWGVVKKIEVETMEQLLGIVEIKKVYKATRGRDEFYEEHCKFV